MGSERGRRLRAVKLVKDSLYLSQLSRTPIDTPTWEASADEGGSDGNRRDGVLSCQQLVSKKHDKSGV